MKFLALLFVFFSILPTFTSNSQTPCYQQVTLNNSNVNFWLFDGDINEINNSNSFQTVAAPTFSTTSSIIGSAYYFNGADIKRLIASSSNFMTSSFSNLSWGAWLKPDNLNTNMMIFDEGGSTRGISVHLNTTGNIVITVRENNTGGNDVSFPFPTDGQFHHVAFTFNGADSGRLIAYLDGYIVAAYKYPNISNIAAHTNGSAIGGLNSTAAIQGFFSGFTPSNYSGYMDEMYYSHTLVNPGNLLQYLRCLGYATWQGIGCASDAFMSQTNTGIWLSIDLASGTVAQPVDDNKTDQINAIGYNELDGLIYGLANGNNHKFICATEAILNGNLYTYKTQYLARIPDLSEYNTVIGDVYNGALYLKPNNVDTMYIVDVNPNSTSYLKLLSKIKLSGTLSVTDIAFSKNGRLFAIENPTGNLLQINTTNGSINTIATGIVPGGNPYGASYFDYNDHLYVYKNLDGIIYRIKVDGPNYTGIIFSTGVGNLDFNDGARCASASLPLDFGDLPDSSTYQIAYGVGSGQYQTSLVNNGPRHFINPQLPLYFGNGVTEEENHKIEDEDDGLFNIPVLTYDPLATFNCSIPISVHNYTGKLAYISGWVDWNNNGIFEATEQLTQTLTSSAFNDTLIFVWENRTWHPSLATTQNLHARFRIATDLSAHSPIGAADDGEVEDYKIMIAQPLPTHLRSFKAQLQDDHVVLNWNISQPKEYVGYYIERSINNNEWITINYVSSEHSMHNENFTASYQTEDRFLGWGKHLYRLKLMHHNGNITYSGIELIDRLQQQAFYIYPNPSKEHITLKGLWPGANISIIDLQGKTHATYKVPLNQYEYSINTATLIPGTYIIQLTHNNKTIFSQKITVL